MTQSMAQAPLSRHLFAAVFALNRQQKDGMRVMFASRNSAHTYSEP